MAGIKHHTTTAAADDPAYDVSKDEWNEEHAIIDDGTAFDLYIQSNSTNAFTADRILTLDLDDAARTLKFSGNPTLGDWFDQSLKQANSPTFVGETLTSLTATRLVASDGAKALASSDLVNWVAGTTNELTVTDDGDGTITLSSPIFLKYYLSSVGFGRIAYGKIVA